MDELSGTAARPGWVYLVAAGPGDPGLLSRRGAELLASADLLLHDQGTEALLELAAADCRRRQLAATHDHDALVAELTTEARDGRSAVWLMAAEPLLHEAGVAVALALRAAAIPFEVAPGVGPAQAAAAFGGVPLGRRGAGLTTIDLRGAPTHDWATLRGRARALCLQLPASTLGAVGRGLMIDAGWSADTPAALLQHPGEPRQRCLEASLGGLVEAAAEAGLSGELLLLIEEGVDRRSALGWFDSQPLFGKRVLVTRPAHQAGPTLAALRRRGAVGVPFATIAIEPPPEPARVRQAVAELDRYDLVAFTSDNGVTWFWQEIERQGRDARAFGRAKVAAIGPATAAGLRSKGVVADVVAETFVAEHLAEAILDAVPGGQGRVLLPRALVAREVLPDTLRAAGLQVDVVPVYRTVGASTERREELEGLLDGIDVVMLTSSSTVEHLCAILGEAAASRLARCKLASIGPITSKTATDLGLDVWVSAEVSTAAGLIDAMESAARPS